MTTARPGRERRTIVDELPVASLVIMLVFTAGLSYFAWFQYDRFVNALLPSSPDEARGCVQVLYASPALKWAVRLAYTLMLLTTVALLVARLTLAP